VKPSPEVISFIREHDTYVILGHREPDGDCIASQAAFRGLLSALGKEGTLVSAGPFDRPEIASFGGLFLPVAPPELLTSRPAVAVLDCSTPDRSGSAGAGLTGLSTLVVDHHSSGEEFGTVRYIEVPSPSTTLLVLSLFDAFGLTPTREQARLILFGLCTDTGFFRHLGEGSAAAFRDIARLVEMGTSTAEVFQMVFGKRNLAARKLLALMLDRTESHREGRLLLSWQSFRDRAAMDGALRGEDELYRLLQTVKGVEVVVLIKEEAEGQCSVGLRSTPDVDVGVVARSFGGGGHRQAAGCDVKGSVESVRASVLAALDKVL
jgi:bifunctional oligoribonuclease and PAP phosphatase NrnA